MPQVKCPRCGARLTTAQRGITLTPRQRAILQAVKDISRNDKRKVASSKAIAAAVGWSVRTVQNELSHLEHINEVNRRGVKGGWYPAESDLVLVEAEAA